MKPQRRAPSLILFSLGDFMASSTLRGNQDKAPSNSRFSVRFIGLRIGLNLLALVIAWQDRSWIALSSDGLGAHSKWYSPPKRAFVHSTWRREEFGKSEGGFDSGRAKWTIQKHQDWWVIGVVFDSTEGFSSRQHRAGSFGADLFLIGEKPPYKIHLVVGDADAGHGMEFIRSKI